MKTSAYLAEQLNATLDEECGISANDFEVLTALVDSTAGRRGISELAGRVPLTASGLSRLIDRLESRQLVTRSRLDGGDGRSTLVEITDRGRELHDVAARAHASRVRALFLKKMSRAELETLSGIWASIAPADDA